LRQSTKGGAVVKHVIPVPQSASLAHEQRQVSLLSVVSTQLLLVHCASLPLQSWVLTATLQLESGLGHCAFVVHEQR
jgi:hypothetical protein